MPDADRLSAVTLDEAGLPPPTPEIEQERQVAIFDLLESNRFRLAGATAPGPYQLTLAVNDGRLGMRLATEGGEAAGLGLADIDLARLAEVRGQLPSLANKREVPKSPLQ